MHEKLAELEARLNSLEEKVNIVKLKSDLSDLEQKTYNPNFWDDPESARQIMKKISRLKDSIFSIESVKIKYNSLYKDFETSVQDPELEVILNEQVHELENSIDKLEFLIYLSDKYDPADALFSIHAGQGGTEIWIICLLF